MPYVEPADCRFAIGPLKATALTVVLLSLLGVLDGIVRWAPERGVNVSGTEAVLMPPVEEKTPGGAGAVLARLPRPQDRLSGVPIALEFAFVAAAALAAGWTTHRCRSLVALGYGLSEFMMAASSRQRARFVRQLFLRHVPPDLADAVSRCREEFRPGGRFFSQNLKAIVLFVDLRSFVARPESMDARVTMQRTSEDMETMRRLIVADRGVVEECVGDAL
jgi:hypothetical protein